MKKKIVSLTSLEKSSIRTGLRNEQTLTSRLSFSSLSFSSLLIVRSTTYSGSCRVESKKIIDITSLEKSLIQTGLRNTQQTPSHLEVELFLAALYILREIKVKKKFCY